MQKQTEPRPEVRRIGATHSFCDARLALGHVAFSLTDLVKESGLSAIAALRQLSRLGGNVARVSPRQAFFLIIAPEHRAMGAPPATWWLQDYFDWLGRPYFLALQSAASLFGSNPQALQVTQVMTDHPRRAIHVGRVHVRFFVKRALGRTPTQQPVGAVAPLRVSTPEATAFDLIRYAARIGGIERAAETIAPLLPALRARPLERVLDAENEPVAAQRLGFVLESAGARQLAKAVRHWLPDKLVPVTLASTKEKGGDFPLVQRWQILNNSRELKI